MDRFEQLFGPIDAYQQALGYLQPDASSDVVMKQTRDIFLAMFIEVAEAVDSTPWKPWRPEGYAKVDRENLKEELVDILFFVNAIRRLHGLSWSEMSKALDEKLRENYSRIENGYNNMKGEHR